MIFLLFYFWLFDFIDMERKYLKDFYWENLASFTSVDSSDKQKTPVYGRIIARRLLKPYFKFFFKIRSGQMSHFHQGT